MKDKSLGKTETNHDFPEFPVKPCKWGMLIKAGIRLRLCVNHDQETEKCCCGRWNGCELLVFS